jgi:predicted metal-dependent hydrolase
VRQTGCPTTAPLCALAVQGLPASVEIRRHHAARRMTLRVSCTRRAVIVTMPMECDLDQAGRFVSTHLDWLRERLVGLPESVPFEDGRTIPLRGIPHRVAFCGVRRGGRVVEIEQAASGTPALLVSGEAAHAPRRLLDFLARQAASDLDARVRWHASRLKLRPKRITIRDQTSRWGSCSTTGALSFSWRLVLAPPMVLDYVAAHEVAHLAEMNHGPRFWALVRCTMPEMDEAKSWLKRFGTDLHRYGPVR